jgi:hypothetical protein
MRSDLITFEKCQVFLNYPFDAEFRPLAYAMHFAVIAAGLIPLCAKDMSVPDRPRFEMLIDAIIHSHYSVHDFSRFKGEGSNNLARFNMPIEMGMALFYALNTQRRQHRCAFFVATAQDYQRFASDLSGLDPTHYNNDELLLVAGIYEWLRDVGKPLVNELPVIEVKDKYSYFKSELEKIKGSESDSLPSHDETQELMYKICSECKWWEWREQKLGKLEFPLLPLSWKISSENSGGKGKTGKEHTKRAQERIAGSKQASTLTRSTRRSPPSSLPT